MTVLNTQYGGVSVATPTKTSFGTTVLNLATMATSLVQTTKPSTIPAKVASMTTTQKLTTIAKGEAIIGAVSTAGVLLATNPAVAKVATSIIKQPGVQKGLISAGSAVGVAAVVGGKEAITLYEKQPKLVSNLALAGVSPQGYIIGTAAKAGLATEEFVTKGISTLQKGTTTEKATLLGELGLGGLAVGGAAYGVTKIVQAVTETPEEKLKKELDILTGQLDALKKQQENTPDIRTYDPGMGKINPEANPEYVALIKEEAKKEAELEYTQQQLLTEQEKTKALSTSKEIPTKSSVKKAVKKKKPKKKTKKKKKVTKKKKR
jgi:hypothetical protein